METALAILRKQKSKNLIRFDLDRLAVNTYASALYYSDFLLLHGSDADFHEHDEQYLYFSRSSA